MRVKCGNTECEHYSENHWRNCWYWAKYAMQEDCKFYSETPMSLAPVERLVRLLPLLWEEIDNYVEAVEGCGCSTDSIYESRKNRALAKGGIIKIKKRIIGAI